MSHVPSFTLRPIAAIAADLGLNPDFLEPYGRDKAKVRLEAPSASAACRQADPRLGADADAGR